jgi:hypothetical protein
MNLPRIRGWLLVYLVALGYVTLHSTALTAASIVIYAETQVGYCKQCGFRRSLDRVSHGMAFPRGEVEFWHARRFSA